MLEYKGYTGKVEYIDDAKIFHGEVLGTRDVITFEGTTVREIERAFRESIDDYLRFCEEEGEDPDKSYSGKFNVRIPESLHRQLAEYAKLGNESLNDVVLRSLVELLEKESDVRARTRVMEGESPVYSPKKRRRSSRK